MALKAKKRFGQNFLSDDRVISDILLHLNPKPNENLIEIGPGVGALTEPVLKKAKQLKAIELDNELIPYLLSLNHDGNNLDIIHQDVLTVDFNQFGNNQRVFGNLPYNISTPLIFHLLKARHLVTDFHFMLQKEVVDRLCAKPNSKAYGQLSVVVQAAFEVNKLFEVAPEAFNPAPKVVSAVMRLKPKAQLAVSLDKLSELAKVAFAKRRKTLNNNFRGLFELSLLEDSGIDGTRRAETLNLEEFCHLTEHLEKHPELRLNG